MGQLTFKNCNHILKSSNVSTDTHVLYTHAQFLGPQGPLVLVLSVFHCIEIIHPMSFRTTKACTEVL